MSEELKPCPMCGGPGELSWYRSSRVPHGQEKESDKAHVIKCLSCGLDGNRISIPIYMPTAEQAAKLWNTRHITLDQAKQVLADSGGEWISVDDRLPRIGEMVIVGRCDGIRAALQAMYDGDSFVCFSTISGEKPFASPTHWQPMPQPPQEKPDA